MTETAAPAAETPRESPATQATRIAFRWMRAATETRSLVFLALCVRLLAGWSTPAVLNDSAGLLRAARRVLADGPGALLDVPHHPLPVAVFAAGELLGDPLIVATVLCAAASALAVWPIHSLARRACGRHAATATCILYVALPKAVEVGSLPLAEGLFLPLFLGSLALAAAARDAGSRIGRRLVAAGVLAGLAYLARPEGLVALPGIAAAAVLDGRVGRLRRLALVTLGFVLVAAPYAVALSSHRGHLALTPKKDVVRFVGRAPPRVGVPETPPPVEAPAAAPVPETSVAAVVGGVVGALDSALTVPVAIAVLIGLLGPSRWRRRRSRRPRLLLTGTSLLLLALLLRLQAGWGYAGGRHAVGLACVLLVFAGQGLATLGAVLPRVTSRRRFTIVTAVLLAIPLGARALLRPGGEGGLGARRLGEAVARVEPGGRELRIASVAEPLVAFYADRELRAAGGAASDVPLWGRFAHPVEGGAPLEAVADALADELRDGADVVVFDVRPPREGRAPSTSFLLAGALRERGVLGSPAIAAGGRLAAFPVRR